MNQSISRLRLGKGSLLTNSMFLIANTLAGSGFGFLFWFLAARLYPPAQLGVGAAYISAVTFLASFGEMGLGTAIIRFAPRLGADQADFINSALSAAALCTLIGAVVFVAGAPLWSPDLDQLRRSGAHLMLFLGTTVGFGLAQMLDRLFVAFQATHLLFARNTLANAIRLVLIVTAGRRLGAEGLLLAVGAAALITLAVATLALAPRALPGYRPRAVLVWRLLQGKATYTLGNHFALFLWNAPPLLYPLLIVALLGPEANARFYISWMVANLLFIVPTAISTSAFAQASSHERTDDQRFWRTMRRTLAGLVPLTLALVAPAQLVLRAFGKEYAAAGSGMFLYLVISVLPYAANTFIIVHHRIHQRTQRVIWVSAAITLSCLGLSASLGAGYGLTGVGLGWMAGQALGVLIGRWSLGSRSSGITVQLSAEEKT